MEEKKKVRPTWTMVKNLEKKLAEAEETVHRQCVELDAWREKYRELAAKNAEAVGLKAKAVQRLEEAEAMLQNAKDRVIECNKITQQAKKECDRLRSRGLIARILNR